MEDVNDELSQLIIDRLGARKSKLDRIELWEHPSKKKVQLPLIGAAIAACAVGAICLPWNEIFSSDSGIEVSRSAETNIQWLIDEGKYEEALQVVQVEQKRIDSTLTALKNGGKLDDETQYEIQALQLELSDLNKQYDFLQEIINK